jgi:outer membrane protein OmpA-like peptidoglycan-associated protein
MKTPSQPTVASLILFAALPAFGQTAKSNEVGGNLSYAGANTRIGIGIDSELKGRAEISQVFGATDTTSVIGELWFARHRAAGAQLQYNWLSGTLGDLGNARVHKIFAAIDQNSDRARKVTFGYGQEVEAYHWAAYLSKGLNKSILTGTSTANTTSTATGIDTALGPFTQDTITTITTQTFAKPYEWGLGVRGGKWYAPEAVRFTAGVDYEWGKDSNRQIAASLQAEKYFPYTPLSVSVIGGVGHRSGASITDKGLHFGQLMLRYDLFGKNGMGSWSQGAGWRGPTVTKKMETLTEMRTETRTEMRTETREVDVPVQVTIPGSAGPTTTKTEARTRTSSEVREVETYFDLGKSGLTGKGKTDLDGLLAQLKATGQSCRVSINVIGHTCPTGSDRNNTPLSQRRADAVKDYLARNGQYSSISTEARAGKSPKYPEVRGQTFRNRRADTQAVIACDVTENVTVEVAGVANAPRTETRMEKRKETVQVPTQVSVQVPVQVQKERTESVPVSWVPRALGTSIPHLQTVSMYTTQSKSTTTAQQPRTYTNQCPAPTADSATVKGNSTANMIDVLANDKDADGNTLSIASVTQPLHGTATISGGKLIYTPTPNYSGADSFTYTVSDGFCGTKTATVNITVSAPDVPLAPLACSAQSYQFRCGTGTDIDLTGAAKGGTGAVTYSLPPRGIYGIITKTGEGKYRYDANQSVCFDREFVEYTATDAAGKTCTGKIELIDPPKRRDGVE